MKVFVKMLQGTECSVEIDETTKTADIKEKIEKDLNVLKAAQCLVFKGKTMSDETNLLSAGLIEGSKIHLMVKKEGKASTTKEIKQNSSKSTDLFTQLDILLRNHLSAEETTKVVREFKKNCQLMLDSMNFDDIERFAASNFTEF